MRAIRGISQTVLATDAGISRRALTDIERGTRIPSVESALKIAESLDTPIGELFSLSHRCKECGKLHAQEHGLPPR